MGVHHQKELILTSREMCAKEIFLKSVRKTGVRCKRQSENDVSPAATLRTYSLNRNPGPLSAFSIALTYPALGQDRRFQSHPDPPRRQLTLAWHYQPQLHTIKRNRHNDLTGLLKQEE